MTTSMQMSKQTYRHTHTHGEREKKREIHIRYRKNTLAFNWINYLIFRLNCNTQCSLEVVFRWVGCIVFASNKSLLFVDMVFWVWWYVVLTVDLRCIPKRNVQWNSMQSDMRIEKWNDSTYPKSGSMCVWRVAGA